MQESKQKIYFNKPSYSDSDKEAIAMAFSAQSSEQQQALVTQLEHTAAEVLGIAEPERLVALNSAASALHLSLLLSGATAHSSVLCPTLSDIAIPAAILQTGATPVFIDSDSETFNLDIHSLKRALHELQPHSHLRPVAIVVKHLNGMPARIDQIIELAREYNAVVIEEASQAWGSYYKEQLCGTWGNYAIWGFGGKSIIAAGSGALLLCPDVDTADKARRMLLTTEQLSNYKRASTACFSYQIDRFAASLATSQLHRLSKMVENKHNTHTLYKKLLSPITGIRIVQAPHPHIQPNILFTSLLIDSSLLRFSKDELLLRMQEQGIESRSIEMPLHMQPYYSSYPFYSTGISDVCFQMGLYLPSSIGMHGADLLAVCDFMKEMVFKFSRM